MQKRSLLWYVPIHVFAFYITCTQCMEPITKKLIEKHTSTFATFVTDTQTKLSKIPRPGQSSWIPSWTSKAMNFALGSAGGFLGYGSITLDDIQFLDRFFADKEKITETIEALAEQEKSITHIAAIFTTLQQKENGTFDDLRSAIDEQTKTCFASEKVQDKDEAGVYVIADDIYFHCTACNLLATYFFENNIVKTH